ncbi:MAG: glycoside hydrolase family 2 protein, partial [Bacteroidetes bacterium]|nr:glycoside hydrolase family 2 protein [Bacteroidota bacterium]
MKFYQFFVLSLFLLSCYKDHIPNETKELDLQWEFRQVGTDNWYPATVPGVVHTDLLNNGLIEDPYWENNEQKLQWIEQENWEYKSILKLAKKQLQNDHLELVFEGLDTYAEIYLN